MNFKRIGMAIVSLVLVACLIVNVSPIKTQAVGPVEVVASTFILSLIIGLALNTGASAGSKVLNNLVNNFWYTPFSEGYMFDPNTFDPQYILAETGTVYIHEDVVQAVRDYLFSYEFIVDSDIPEGYALYNDVLLPVISDSLLAEYPYCYIYFVDYLDGYPHYWLTCSDRPFFIDQYSIFRNVGYSSGINYASYVLSDDSSYWVWNHENIVYTNPSASFGSAGGVIDEYTELIWSSYDIGVCERQSNICIKSDKIRYSGSSALTSESVVISEDLQSDEYVPGYIAPADQSLEEGYPLWHQQSISVPKDDGTVDVFYPVGLGNDYTESLNWLQEQVWSGHNTLDWGNTDTDTDTDVDEEAIAGTLGGTQTGTFLNGLKETMSGLFAGVTSGIDSFKETVSASFAQSITKVESIPEEVSGAIAGVLADVFIPADDYFDNHFNALTTEYSFANSIAMTGMDLKDFFSDLGSVPPVIRINFSESKGRYNWGNDMVLIDFSFYEPYKPTMDAILSAFLWLWFCWRVVLSLPGIMGGASAIFGGKNDSSLIGSSGYSHTPSTGSNVPLLESHSSGYVRQTPEERQRSSSGYNDWRRSR